MPLPLANQINLQVQNGRADEIGRLGKSGDVKSTEHAKGNLTQKVTGVFKQHALVAKTEFTRGSFADAVMTELRGRHISQQHLNSGVLAGISSKLSIGSDGYFGFPSGEKLLLTLGQANYLLQNTSNPPPQGQSLAQNLLKDETYQALIAQELDSKWGTELAKAILDPKSAYYNTSPEMGGVSRFRNIRPPLETGIELSNKMPINANRIVIGGRVLGIATQAPTANTLNEFWQMISEQKVQLIVDLTSDKDRAEKGIPDYRPTNNTYQHPDVQLSVTSNEPLYDNLVTVEPLYENIHTEETSEGAAAIYENINTGPSINKEAYKLADVDGERPLIALHYKKWPDHGVISVKELHTLVQQINQRLDELGHDCQPVIHCNAGVGRSGTILSALSLQKDFAEKKLTESNCDDRVLQTIVEGKQARGGQFVQTAEQAKLVAEFAHSLFDQKAL